MPLSRTTVQRQLATVLALLLSLLATAASAFHCPPNESLQARFKKASRVMLIYVLETRLEEKLQEQMVKEHEADGGDPEAVKLVSAGYRVIEDFKGDKTYQPRLLDPLGIGTGYVGLTPGMYYVVFLETPEESPPSGMQGVDICSVPFSHYRLNVPEFQSQVDTVRKIMKAQK